LLQWVTVVNYFYFFFYCFLIVSSVLQHCFLNPFSFPFRSFLPLFRLRPSEVPLSVLFRVSCATLVPSYRNSSRYILAKAGGISCFYHIHRNMASIYTTTTTTTTTNNNNNILKVNLAL
jgi:hypothetical protein